MTSSLERTARKTLVASIVALHGNGCKQASYSVHVTIYWKKTVLLISLLNMLASLPNSIDEPNSE
jgi:hypothetical protein